MSTILCIDTASPEIALAVAIDGQVLRDLARDGTMAHSQLLLASIAAVLGDAGHGLSGIAVVRGPGNYAGLRVGLATAQGLGLARGIPVRGISTLEAAARAAGIARCTVIHPAGRGEFAAQEFEDAIAQSPMRVAALADLESEKGRNQLVGEGAGAFAGIEVTPVERCRAALLALARSFATPGDSDVDALYLREPNITLPRTRAASARR